MNTLDFYKGKRVLVTGHTGFKGSWLCHILAAAGACVTGYSLGVPDGVSLYELSGAHSLVNSVIGDVRDLSGLSETFEKAQPQIVFHLAAQPIVFEGYRDPVRTYETNVMGTVNLLECVRATESVKSVLNVTTDKVYFNAERAGGYREDETLDGFDPYSNSKSCSELVTATYRRCYFANRDVSVSTSRAGNAIGGGDFSAERMIPNCIRSLVNGEAVKIRSPHSVRPYQHVLDSLFAYLLIASKQYTDKSYEGSYNVGPLEDDCMKTSELVELFIGALSDKARWEAVDDNTPHEALSLRLDCSKMENTFGWHPVWNSRKAVEKLAEWVRVYFDGGNIADITRKQISEFCSDAGSII